MDSANSGSLQSSSGGDEECDSRAADSVSAFMSGGGGGPIPNHPPPFYDLSGYLQLHQNPNSSLLNPNLSWPRNSAPPLRSDPNPISQNDAVHSMFPTSNPYMPCFQPAAAGTGGADSGGGGGSAAAASQLNHTQVTARNPKKRSRASRRAPTTVLTTDTTNFRAMVQEFTGIPAPPFNSSSFPRSRLDFFGSRSAAFDAAQPPPYLRRPFAQKVQPPHPFLASSSSSSLLSSAAFDSIAVAASTTANNGITPTAAAAASRSSMNYQLPMTQSSSLFNINPNQNILTSLLQSNPKFLFSTSAIITSKPQNSFEIPSHDDQFSLNHSNQVSETLAALPNLFPSDQIAPRNDHDGGGAAGNAARWSGDKDDRADLRPHNGGYDFERSTMGGKMSFSASSTSGFHGGKEPENVGGGGAAARGEGMVESWICSSE